MDVLAIVSRLLDIILALVPIETAKAQLSQKEAELANASADAVEIARWGKTSGAPPR